MFLCLPNYVELNEDHFADPKRLFAVVFFSFFIFMFVIPLSYEML